jgi:hypothetical protein
VTFKLQRKKYHGQPYLEHLLKGGNLGRRDKERGRNRMDRHLSCIPGRTIAFVHSGLSRIWAGYDSLCYAGGLLVTKDPDGWAWNADTKVGLRECLGPLFACLHPEFP